MVDPGPPRLVGREQPAGLNSEPHRGVERAARRGSTIVMVRPSVAWRRLRPLWRLARTESIPHP